jgi:hypothetical protein
MDLIKIKINLIKHSQQNSLNSLGGVYIFQTDN